MFVYLITNKVNGKVYVGKTKFSDPLRRWYQHKRDAVKGCQFPLHRGIRKHGVENFVFSVLESGCLTNEQLSSREIFWIEKLDARIPSKGYNVAHGGEGGYGKGLPEHYRRQHSENMSGPGNPSFGKPFPAAHHAGTLAATKWCAEHPEEKKAICSRASLSSWENTTAAQRTLRNAPMVEARWKAHRAAVLEKARALLARNTLVT